MIVSSPKVPFRCQMFTGLLNRHVKAKGWTLTAVACNGFKVEEDMEAANVRGSSRVQVCIMPMGLSSISRIFVASNALDEHFIDSYI